MGDYSISKAFSRAFKTYGKISTYAFGFSIFVLASLLLTPLVASFVNVGGGFIRFSSVVYDLTVTQLAVLALSFFASLLFLSFFITAIIVLVKMQETLDHYGLKKVFANFQGYMKRVFAFFLLFSLLTIALGVVLDYYGVSRALIQLLVALVWLAVVFSPQIIVLEDFSLFEAVRDSMRFIKETPTALLAYVVFGFACFLVLALAETVLGSFFVWEHKL